MKDQPEYYLTQAFDCPCGDVHEWAAMHADQTKPGWFNVICPVSGQTVDSLEVVRWSDVEPDDDFRTFKPAWPARQRPPEEPPMTWTEIFEWTAIGFMVAVVLAIIVAAVLLLSAGRPRRPATLNQHVREARAVSWLKAQREIGNLDPATESLLRKVYFIGFNDGVILQLEDFVERLGKEDEDVVSDV